MENIEILNSGGLVCDNTKCDWEDKTVKVEDYPDWLNKPCPKCGENVLTEDDYNNHLLLLKMIEFVNTLSPEELAEFNDATNGLVSDEDMKKFDGFNPEDEVIMTVNTSHGKPSITNIKTVDDDNK